MNVYVASSWRNDRQPTVVTALRVAGHEVYDFRNPAGHDRGFHWSDIDSKWESWSPLRFRDALDHHIAVDGFELDWGAMRVCDACVLVMPCGRSAHLESGYFVGCGKPLVILLSDGEPELMYRMATHLCLDVVELVQAVARL